jgi:DinB superfamily
MDDDITPGITPHDLTPRPHSRSTIERHIVHQTGENGKDRVRMAVHPRVEQLQFARSEFVRALDGVGDEQARRRFLPMNSISWMIGHLASQEYRYWVFPAQGQNPLPIALELAAYGKPATTPPLDLAWTTWRAVIDLVDPYLDSLTSDTLESRLVIDGQPHDETLGTMVQRVTYHYWFHTGESQAVRQLLGHTNLPEFVGDFPDSAAYRPESTINS